MTKYIKITLLTLLFATNAQAKTDTIEFIYNPGDQKFTKEIESSKKSIEDGVLSIDHKEYTALSITTKKTSTGWRLIEKNDKSLLINKEPEKNPFKKLLEDAVITYHIDSNGALRNIEGFDAINKKIMRSLPPGMPKSMMDKMDMRKFKENEWKKQIESFSGKTYEINKASLSKESFNLPSGAIINYDVVTTVHKSNECPSQPCVLIKQEYKSKKNKRKSESESESESDFIRGIIKDNPNQIPEVTSSNFTLTGKSERTLNPQTMLTYYQKSEKSIMIETAMGQRGVTEKRSVKFNYN